MKTRNLVIALFAMAIAITALSQLSMEKADWVNGPVQYLMTAQEKEQWKALKTDADADKFIALFWARRDPTPNTPRNEFREEFESRVAFADKSFAGPRQRGSLTDRGRILVVFGAPTKALRQAPGAGQLARPTPETETAGTEEVLGEKQTWVYEGESAQKLFGSPHVEFQFVDRLNNHDMRMQPPRIDLNAVQQRIISAEIVQPNLTQLPTFQESRPAAQPQVPAAPPAPVTTLKTAALETAVADAAKSAPAKGAVFSYVEFLSPTGEFYVSAGLYIPASSVVTAEGTDTFFGVVDDAAGKRVLAFEEPARPTFSPKPTVAVETTTTATSSSSSTSVSKPVVVGGNLFFDKTLDLSSGKYTVVFGLAKGGAPVLLVASPLEVNTIARDATGTSKLLLSNDIQTTKDAAPMKTPFAFGQLKIVPKADLVFTNKDDLNYFVELHNPGIDPATKEPKLQMKMELDDTKGKPVAGAPLTDVPAAPLSGQTGPGEYAIVSGIPLSQMTKPLAPGEYTLKMKILDTVSKQSYSLEQKFRIAA